MAQEQFANLAAMAVRILRGDWRVSRMVNSQAALRRLANPSRSSLASVSAYSHSRVDRMMLTNRDV